MLRQIIVRTTFVVCLILAGGSNSSGQDVPLPEGLSKPAMRFKPAEVTVPSDVPLGQYRRIIQPFENWILYCDENLKERQRVCNISQTIIDQNDEQVFSWSLAATKKGEPMMIMRVPPGVGKEQSVTVKFPDRGALLVKVVDCSPVVCIAMLPVGPVVRAQIKKQSSPIISYKVGTKEIAVRVPLKGLETALSEIK